MSLLALMFARQVQYNPGLLVEGSKSFAFVACRNLRVKGSQTFIVVA